MPMATSWTIDDLDPAPTADVAVRGRTLRVRMLSDAETTAIAACFERPQAPLVPRPGAGSLADPVRNEQDPEFRRKTVEWNADVEAASAAAATGYALTRPGGGPATWDAAVNLGDAERAAWCRAAAAELRRALGVMEIRAIDRAQSEMLLGKAGGPAPGPAPGTAG